MSPSGIITTVAGTGSAGFSGDGGLAIAARLRPAALALAPDGRFVGLDTFRTGLIKISQL